MRRLSASGLLLLFLSVCWSAKLMLNHGVFVRCVTVISKCTRLAIVKSIVLIFKELFVVLLLLSPSFVTVFIQGYS